LTPIRRFHVAAAICDACSTDNRRLRRENK
jgi:hypothetical protein